MQKSSTIAIVTGNRAEYYLLEPVILKLEKLPKVTTEVLVSGTHLENKEKGSLQDLRKNLNSQLRLIPIHSQNSIPSEVCIQISQAVEKFGQCFQNHHYDLLIVLGDRHEILAACIAALIHQIPIAHINGGDVTEGSIDECFRHSITKMSNYHFPATQLSAIRISQMGELSTHIFVSGSLGVEIATSHKSTKNKEKIINKPYALLTCHSETTSLLKQIPVQQMELFKALESYSGSVLITKSNCDLGGHQINEIHNRWVTKYPEKFHKIDNLGLFYHTALEHADFCIGNSSSALIEAPALHTPSIDLGNRQKGRERGSSVLHSEWSSEQILSKINICIQPTWRNQKDRYISPYYSGTSKPSDIIVDNIKKILDEPKVLKKFQLSNATLTSKKN